MGGALDKTLIFSADLYPRRGMKICGVFFPFKVYYHNQPAKAGGKLDGWIMVDGSNKLK